MNNDILQQPSVNFDEKDVEISSLRLLLFFIRRFIVLIAVCTVIGTVLGVGYALVKDKKVYTQTKSLVVIARIDNATLSTNIALTKKWWATLPKTITSPVFISRAQEVYGDKNDKISAGALKVNNDTGMILTISYSDYDPDVAAKKLDAYIEAASQEIQAEDKNYVTADSVEFTSIDSVARTSVSVGFFKYVLIGVIGGAAIGFLIAFLVYLLDSTVNTNTELERLTGVMVVAYIDDVA